ncbi:uncharacterized protein JCM10292_004861 [Rhodotorula paludigena]|uniref:uncharacterized protein n=1 Tax=Rhodotorula paludigena TaxID=86838 RepID=UPI0031804A14
MQPGYGGYGYPHQHPHPHPQALPPGFAYPYPPHPVPSTSQHPAQLPLPHLAPAPDPAQQPPRKRSRLSSTGAGSAKGKKVVIDAETDEDDDDEDEKARKKRLPLSCTECQRRKIKCSRGQPCEACIRRKKADVCSYDDEDVDSPYALNTEVRAISRRLAHLESLFHQVNPHLASASGGVAAFHTSPASLISTPSVHASPNVASNLFSAPSQSLPPPPPKGAPSSALPHPAAPAPAATTAQSDPASQSDTEDAVADLEEQTFGARVPVLRALHAAAQSTAVATYKYVKVPDMELTSCWTSILAEPLSFDQDGRPRSAVRLGLDLAVSTTDLPAVRHDALAQILAVLPDPEIAQYLIRKYFDEMEWDFRVLDPVAFPIEHERYVEMLSQGREDLIDPLWIACFCMVLALSIEGFWSRPRAEKDLSLFRGLPEQALKDFPSVWHDAALRALQLGEWGGTPRIRTIQCIILFGQYIQIASSSGQQGRFLGWAASAIRVAQRMGLHRLGSNPQTMPPDDPALPPGSNACKRESAIRLWHHLVNIDSWLSDSPCFRCYLLHPSQYNTARPLNLNLRDLSRTDWQTPTPPPPTVYTDASFQLVQCKVAEQIRGALDKLVLSDSAFSYAAVLEQDKAWRDVLVDVPDVFREGGAAPPSARIAYERACLHEDVYSRLVRLNRPFLGRGYNPSSPYRHSTLQCIEAAKKLISSNFEMLQIETSRWWMYTGTLASSIVLMMDLFHAIDHDRPADEIKDKRDVLSKARTIFDTKAATPALEAVVEEGRKIISALLDAEESRRTTRAAHEMASTPIPSLEPFSQVLKRVSRQVAAEEAKPVLPFNSGLTPANYAVTPSPYPGAHSTAVTPSSAAPVSFAHAAANAMANTPSSLDPSFAAPTSFENGDFSSFFNTLASEDWTAATFTSPGGDEAGLLDQLAATW